MSNLLKQKQLVAVAGLVALGIVIGLAGLLVAVLPQGSKATSLDAQIQAEQTKLISLQGAAAQRGPAIKAADLFQLARAMPDQADVPGLLIELSNLAARAKVTYSSVTIADPVVQVDGSSAWPLHLTLTGTWAGITAYLRELRNEVQVSKTKLKVHGRLFEVDNMQLAGKADGTDGIDATMSVNAFTYGVAAPAPLTTDTTSTDSTTPPAAGSTQAAGASGGTG